MYSWLDNNDINDMFQSIEKSRPQTPEELVGVLEGVRAFEAMVQAAEEPHRKYKYKSTDNLQFSICSYRCIAWSQ